MLVPHCQSQQASFGGPLPQHEFTLPTTVPALQCYKAYTAGDAILDLKVLAAFAAALMAVCQMVLACCPAKGDRLLGRPALGPFLAAWPYCGIATIVAFR
jgi:hypothetical protein